MAQPDKPSPPGLSMLARAGHLEYDRVLFFSDAIFAIAITLLVIDISVPGAKNAASEISAAKDNILSFAISFVVIGLFWMGHHAVFRYITVLDRPLIAINLLFLGIIAFLPYPTSLLGGTGTDRVSTIFYAACISGAGLAELAIWLYASQAKDLLVPASVVTCAATWRCGSRASPWFSCCRSPLRSSPRSSPRSSGFWLGCSGWRWTVSHGPPTSTTVRGNPRTRPADGPAG